MDLLYRKFLTLRHREQLADELGRAEAAIVPWQLRSAHERRLGRLREMIAWADKRLGEIDHQLDQDPGDGPQHAFAPHGIAGSGTAGTSCGHPPVVAGAGVPVAPVGMSGA